MRKCDCPCLQTPTSRGKLKGSSSDIRVQISHIFRLMAGKLKPGTLVNSKLVRNRFLDFISDSLRFVTSGNSGTAKHRCIEAMSESLDTTGSYMSYLHSLRHVLCCAKFINVGAQILFLVCSRCSGIIQYRWFFQPVPLVLTSSRSDRPIYQTYLAHQQRDLALSISVFFIYFLLCTCLQRFGRM